MKFQLIVLLLQLALTVCDARNRSSDKYEALEVANLLPVEILKLRGFDSENHYVPTPDGYRINVVRIVNPLIKREGLALKRPVIFNHGLLECASIWLISSRNVRPTFDTPICSEDPFDIEAVRKRNDSLNGPMLMANHGYDVWLMSMRGTELSQRHESLTSSDKEFWSYSLDDFALKDIPSVIDYVLTLTGSRKVGYAGHSQATFSIFGLLATRPHYADLVEPVFAVAPVAYIHHTNSIARAIFTYSLNVPNLEAPFPKFSKLYRIGLTRLCARKLLPFKFTCRLIDESIGGRGPRTPAGYFSHLPFQSSFKVLRHFGQLISKENMTRYDYGEKGNLKRYGTREAPLYDIGNIRSRSICLFSTKTDALSHPADVELFKERLNVPLMKDIFIEKDFNHFDLITNPEAREFVFAPMLQILEEIENRSGVCAEKRLSAEHLNILDNNIF